MSKRRVTKTGALARQTGELAEAVPQVIAKRLSRMALAGAAPSARDRKEFQRMGTEKVEALAESWRAMTLATMQAQQRLALTCMTFPWMLGKKNARSATNTLVRQVGDAALEIAKQGLTPIHRRAVGNAKRLSRAKRQQR